MTTRSYRIRASLSMLIIIATSSKLYGEQSPNPKSSEDVKNYLQMIWHSVETFGFSYEEHNLNDQEIVDDSKGYTKTDIIYGTNGKHKYKMNAVYPDQRRLNREFWEDGKTHFNIVRAEGKPEVIDTAYTKPQTSKPGEYDGPMNGALWIMVPGGYTFDTLISKGASITSTTTNITHNNYSWQMRMKIKNANVVANLDQAHDFLPSTLDIGDSVSIRVERYEKVAGHWYPAEGVLHDKLGKTRRKWTVTNCSFNQHLTERFNPTSSMEKGAMVADIVTHRATVDGGMESRKAFELKHPRPYLDAANEKHEHFGRTSWQGAGYLILGLVAIVAGLFVRRLGKRATTR